MAAAALMFIGGPLLRHLYSVPDIDPWAVLGYQENYHPQKPSQFTPVVVVRGAPENDPLVAHWPYLKILRFDVIKGVIFENARIIDLKTFASYATYRAKAEDCDLVMLSLRDGGKISESMPVIDASRAIKVQAIVLNLP